MKNYLIAFAVVVILAAGYVFLTNDRRPDEIRISSLIDDVTKAANARNLSVCMSAVSSDFKTESDINKDRLRMLVAQAFRSEPNFKMQTSLKNLIINGNTAQAVVYVDIRGWSEGSDSYRKDVNVTLKKESNKRLLIFPSNSWRVTKLDTLVVDGYE